MRLVHLSDSARGTNEDHVERNPHANHRHRSWMPRIRREQHAQARRQRPREAQETALSPCCSQWLDGENRSAVAELNPNLAVHGSMVSPVLWRMPQPEDASLEKPLLKRQVQRRTCDLTSTPPQSPHRPDAHVLETYVRGEDDLLLHDARALSASKSMLSRRACALGAIDRSSLRQSRHRFVRRPFRDSRATVTRSKQ